MKINGTYTLREVAGEILVIPVGETALKMNGMIILNPASQVIWECLEKGADTEQILQAVTEAFDVDPAEAMQDITEFLDQMRSQELLAED